MLNLHYAALGSSHRHLAPYPSNLIERSSLHLSNRNIDAAAYQT